MQVDKSDKGEACQEKLLDETSSIVWEKKHFQLFRGPGILRYIQHDLRVLEPSLEKISLSWGSQNPQWENHHSCTGWDLG